MDESNIMAYVNNLLPF